MKYIPNTRGFIFPFVIFFIVAGVFVVSELYFFHTSGNYYDELSRLQNQANTALEDQATIFKNILAKTNANGGGSAAGSDNDNYALTGSGGSGQDDDVDAFTYRFGTLAPLESKNILLVNPAYSAYVAGLSLSGIGSFSLSLSGSGTVMVYRLDSASRVIGQKSLTVSSWANTIEVTDMNTSDGLALFLANTSSGLTLSYTLYAKDTSGQKISAFIPASNLSAGKYVFYSNVLLQDPNGNFFPFSRVFSN